MMSDASSFSPRGSGDRSTGGGMSSASRGAVLIAIAIIVGIVLLNVIDDGNSGPVGGGGEVVVIATTTTVGGKPSRTTPTTTSAPLPPAQVTVLVLNASGRDGVATVLTNAIKAKGYKTLPPTNGAARVGTVINAKLGRTAECTTLSTVVLGAKVAPMPTPPPNTADADCIVIIGS